MDVLIWLYNQAVLDLVDILICCNVDCLKKYFFFSCSAGWVVFELYSDVVPKTTENFRCLCTGERGEGKSTFKPLHYKGTPIHRIVKGFIVQGGDFSCGQYGHCIMSFVIEFCT